MRELKSPREEIIPDIKLERVTRMPEKRWIAASRLGPGKVNKPLNNVVELFYTQILDLAKTLYATLPDAYSRTVFEKDYRHDNTENCFTMHSFITPSFYWYLECHFAYYYHVQYDFHNCPFEQELRTSMEKRFSYTPNRCSNRKLQPNCEEFYQRVLKVQGEQYIVIL